ncbi:MAG: PDGLE domain-containing protein [Dehalococcoidia bacterium]|nr:PDGLE domain-containing protein [Dehalococcoidia bacterium]
MKNKKWWLVAFAFCLLLATFAPLASAAPDGLERVVEDHNLTERIIEPPFVLIADYLFPGIQNEAVAGVLAGWIGTILVFALAFTLVWLIARKNNTKTPSDTARINNG